MNFSYILIGQTVVPEPDAQAWAEWRVQAFKTHANRVARTTIPGGFVSTVFTGLDTSCGMGLSTLFETMVIIDDNEYLKVTCGTWAEAEAQHKTVVQECKTLLSA